MTVQDTRLLDFALYLSLYLLVGWFAAAVSFYCQILFSFCLLYCKLVVTSLISVML